MIIYMLNKIINFLKDSYSQKLIKILFAIFVLGLLGTWFAINYQHSTIDQRITERKIQIEQENEQKALAYAASYKRCLQQEESKTKWRFYFSPCFNYEGLPLQTEYLYDKSLNGFEELKNNLESGFYYFILILCLAVITVAIPVIRLFWLVSKLLWNKSRAATTILRSESAQMSSFQKYSLVLSVLILIALIAMILILLA